GENATRGQGKSKRDMEGDRGLISGQPSPRRRSGSRLYDSALAVRCPDFYHDWVKATGRKLTIYRQRKVANEESPLWSEYTFFIGGARHAHKRHFSNQV